MYPGAVGLNKLFKIIGKIDINYYLYSLIFRKTENLVPGFENLVPDYFLLKFKSHPN